VLVRRVSRKELLGEGSTLSSKWVGPRDWWEARFEVPRGAIPRVFWCKYVSRMAPTRDAAVEVLVEDIRRKYGYELIPEEMVERRAD